MDSMVVPDVDSALPFVCAVAGARRLVDEQLLDRPEGAEEPRRHKERLVGEGNRKPDHVQQVILHDAEGLQVIDPAPCGHVHLAT